MVNTDIHPATTLIGLVKYIAKYVSKPEKASMAYKDIESQVLKYTSDKSPLLSFTSKTLVGEREYSAQDPPSASYVQTTADLKINRTRRDGLKPERNALQKYNASVTSQRNHASRTPTLTSPTSHS
jgi:hypothetical protein